MIHRILKKLRAWKALQPPKTALQALERENAYLKGLVNQLMIRNGMNPVQPVIGQPNQEPDDESAEERDPDTGRITQLYGD